MNEQEIAQIIGFVHALCPAQKMDEYTPDAWELVLEDIAFADARAALKTLGLQLRFIAPADIAGEVRKIRTARIATYVEAEPDIDDPDDAMAYIAAIRTGRFKAASGDHLKPRPVQAAISRAYHHVESAWNRNAKALPAPRTELTGPTDPEHAAAVEVLKSIPNRSIWIIAARGQLEAEGAQLSHAAVAIRAADLATRTEGA